MAVVYGGLFIPLFVFCYYGAKAKKRIRKDEDEDDCYFVFSLATKGRHLMTKKRKMIFCWSCYHESKTTTGKT